jgi:hypothetical protein
VLFFRSEPDWPVDDRHQYWQDSVIVSLFVLRHRRSVGSDAECKANIAYTVDRVLAFQRELLSESMIDGCLMNVVDDVDVWIDHIIVTI